MSEGLRICAACGAASSAGASVCWVCESALGEATREPPRGRQPELATWLLTVALSLATAVLACVELMQLDPLRAAISLAVVVPVFATLGAMIAQRRAPSLGVRGAYALPSAVCRSALGMVALGLGLLLITVAVGLYSARFASA